MLKLHCELWAKLWANLVHIRHIDSIMQTPSGVLGDRLTSWELASNRSEKKQETKGYFAQLCIVCTVFRCTQSTHTQPRERGGNKITFFTLLLIGIGGLNLARFNNDDPEEISISLLVRYFRPTIILALASAMPAPCARTPGTKDKKLCLFVFGKLTRHGSRVRWPSGAAHWRVPPLAGAESVKSFKIIYTKLGPDKGRAPPWMVRGKRAANDGHHHPLFAEIIWQAAFGASDAPTHCRAALKRRNLEREVGREHH